MIVEKVFGSQIVDINRRKYLVPSDITVAQFMWIIRKRIQLPSEDAIFLCVDKTAPQSRVLEAQEHGLTGNGETYNLNIYVCVILLCAFNLNCSPRAYVGNSCFP